MREPPLLEIANLTVRAAGDTILDRVSFMVDRGTVHALVGPNGAGKSTILAAILGLMPFDGRITAAWRGTPTIGYVPQAFPVDPTLPVTVADFLALTRQRRPVCLGIARRTRLHVQTMLAGVGLEGIDRRPLAQLSGGELRRVLLAHAIDPCPELLVLDEASAGFDEAAGRIFEDTLSDVIGRAGTTVLMASHDLEQVRRTAHRVTMLNRRVLADGPSSRVLSNDVLTARAERPAGRTHG